MRVIGGSMKGRRLASFKCPSIRPTSDKVREAVFNVIERGGPFKRVLDLFAGTGAMGVEALSRGSAEAVFVERDAAAVSVIKKNLRTCGVEDRARVVKGEVTGAIRSLGRKAEGGEGGEGGEKFDLAFIDAPYGQPGLTARTLKELKDRGLLVPGATVVCETSKRAGDEFGAASTGLKGGLTGGIAGMELVREKTYGDTVVYFFKAS